MKQVLTCFFVLLVNHLTGQDLFITNRWCHEEIPVIRIDSIHGLTPPYLYSFNKRAFSKSRSFTPDTTGEFSIIVTDSLHDTVYTSVKLQKSGQLTISTTSTPASCTNRGNFTIQQVLGGIPPITTFINGENTLYSSKDGTVRIIDNAGCQATFEFSIPRICPKPYTGFSPNGDGLNDTWEIENIEDLDQVWIRVTNRFGQVVFESEGSYSPWDGTPKFGGKLPTGSYYYQIQPLGKHNAEYSDSGILILSR